MSIALAGALPADADCLSHHSPALPLFEETADLIFDFAVKLALALHQAPQVVGSRRPARPGQTGERRS